MFEITTHTTPKMLKNAYLELIIGPMFSGKTSYLLDVYKKCNKKTTQCHEGEIRCIRCREFDTHIPIRIFTAT